MVEEGAISIPIRQQETIFTLVGNHESLQPLHEQVFDWAIRNGYSSQIFPVAYVHRMVVNVVRFVVSFCVVRLLGTLGKEDSRQESTEEVWVNGG